MTDNSVYGQSSLRDSKSSCLEPGNELPGYFRCVPSGLLLAFIASVCLILIFTGCAAPGPRSRYIQQIEPSTLTNLVAYRYGTNLELRIPLRGKNAYAHASWPAVDSGTTNYHHRIALLTLDKERRALRRSVSVKTNSLVIRGAEQWRQLLDGVFSGILPHQSDHGVVLMMQNRELVIYRDKAGRFRLPRWKRNPPTSRSITLTTTPTSLPKSRFNCWKRS